MPVESNRFNETSYQIIETASITQDYGSRIVYGLKAEFSGETADELTIGDISTNKDDIERLVTLLIECGVAREHLMDVIEDFVQELCM